MRRDRGVGGLFLYQTDACSPAAGRCSGFAGGSAGSSARRSASFLTAAVIAAFASTMQSLLRASRMALAARRSASEANGWRGHNHAASSPPLPDGVLCFHRRRASPMSPDRAGTVQPSPVRLVERLAPGRDHHYVLQDPAVAHPTSARLSEMSAVERNADIAATPAEVCF
jgi:hypothetical protein